MNNKRKIIPIFVPHLGCKFDCIFCNQKKITGSKNSEVNIKNVIKTINNYLLTMNDKENKEIAFFGGSFTAINKNEQIDLLNIAKRYKNENKINYIRISTRPDAINHEILDFLKLYEVDIIELGVQSLNDKILLNSNRGHTVKDIVTASKLINEYGFILGHQIMPGLPGSSKDIDIDTCKMSIKLEPKIARIYPTLVIKNTQLEDMYNNNMYIPLSLEQAIDLCGIIYSLYISHNINVIRIGLQNTENISINKDVIAGPFHVNFKQKVEEKIFLKSILSILSRFAFNNSNLEINANMKYFNYISGQNQKNLNLLKSKFNIKKIKLNNVSDNTKIIFNLDNKEKISLKINDIYTNYINTQL